MLTGRRLLIVDDDQDTRELSVLALGMFEAEVEAAERGEEALSMLDGSPYDAIVCDIGLPDIDGYEFMRRARAAGYRRAAVAVTGYSSQEDRDAAVAAGYTAYAPKPLDPQDLAALLARLIESADERSAGTD